MIDTRMEAGRRITVAVYFDNFDLTYFNPE